MCSTRLSRRANVVQAVGGDEGEWSASAHRRAIEGLRDWFRMSVMGGARVVTKREALKANRDSVMASVTGRRGIRMVRCAACGRAIARRAGSAPAPDVASAGMPGVQPRGATAASGGGRARARGGTEVGDEGVGVAPCTWMERTNTSTGGVGSTRLKKAMSGPNRATVTTRGRVRHARRPQRQQHGQRRGAR